MTDEKSRKNGIIALVLCLGGLTLVVLLDWLMKTFGNEVHKSSGLLALLYIVFQFTALFLGIFSRKNFFGKIAIILSTLLLLALSLFLI